MTFAPSIKPSDGRLGLKDLAEKLAAEVERNLVSDKKFLLIGFGMGCLISRAYLQLLGGFQRCVEFHAISGPLKGSFWAYFYPGLGARDMRPRSALIQQLHDTEQTLTEIKLISYRTPYDVMILPSKSSHLEIAENVLVSCPVHAWMVKDPIVQQSVLDALNRLDPQTAPPAGLST